MGYFFGDSGDYFRPKQTSPVIPQEAPEKKGFNLKAITPDDADECVDAMVATAPHVKWNREGLRGRLLAPNALTIVARLKEKLVGVISGTFMIPSLPPSIGLMAVFDPKSNAEGLGGYLIDEFIREVKKKEPKALCVDVSLPNLDTSSIALYSLKGFIVNGFIKNEIRSRFGEGVHDLVHLRRWLAKARRNDVV